MHQYIVFFIILAFILVVLVFNKYFFWWVKGFFATYYLVVAYLFVTVRNRIKKEFEGVRPVPEAYWSENSGWVDTITNYLFIPLIGIAIFLYFKWFTKAQTKMSKVFILLSFIPSAILFPVYLPIFIWLWIQSLKFTKIKSYHDFLVTYYYLSERSEESYE